MNACGKKLFLIILLAGMSTPASGQYWPTPSRTANTDVPCDTISCAADPAHDGKLLIGYPSPITTFTGRYLDSVKVGVYFFPIRSARAKNMKIAPDRGRIYTMIGSAVAAYDINTFFTRVGAEEMTLIGGLGLQPLQGAPVGRQERALLPDRIFYAEDNRSGWTVGGGDGEDKMFQYDWDDRGYVYLAAGPYSWGIVKDDGGRGGDFMPSVFQYTAALTAIDPVDPNRILSVKSSAGVYYALVADKDFTGSRPIAIFNVSNPAAPQRQGSTTLRGYRNYAKLSDGTLAFIGIDRNIYIYTPDGLVSGQAPVLTSTGPYLGVTSDGTNFIATAEGNNKAVVITVFAPGSGGSFSETAHVMSQKFSADDPRKGDVFCNKDSGGYFTVITAQQELGGAQNLLLYKLVNLTPTEVPLNNYVARHYGSAAPSGYTYPFVYNRLQGGHVVKRGTKYYLIVEDYSLGDVYEIRGSDSITAKIKKNFETANPYSKGGVITYYGDQLTFTSEYTAAAAPSVTWDFGDGVVQTASPSVPDIAHQYGGLLASELPKTRTVKAANPADSSQSDTISVVLAKPTVRVGVLNTNLFFSQSATNFSLPIVSSDFFTDPSDGAMEGHFSEWRLDTDAASTKQLPNQTYPVGSVGQRTLTFTGHYGPYSGSGATLASTTTDVFFPLSLTYLVRPFVPVVDGPAAAGSNVTFRSGTRVTTKTADLTGGPNTSANYTWELLKPEGTGFVRVGSAVTGSAAISAIPDYVLTRSTFQGANNWKVKLTVTVDNAAVGNNTQYASAFAESGPLVGPTPSAIVKSGCERVGVTCSFSTPSSRPEIDPLSWTYAWSVTGPAAVAGSAQPVFTPAFTTPGNYTVNVTVSNALGDASLSIGPFAVDASLCSSSPTAANTAITFKGATSNCVPFAVCNKNETIEFWISPFGWMPKDGCETYSWNFGDGVTSTLPAPTHQYTNDGQYNVTLVLTGGSGVPVSLTRTVTVGQIADKPVCPAMTSSNVFISYIGPASGCSTVASGPACNAGESIPFGARSFGYNFSCADHTFTWNYGDGQSGSGQDAPHAYANPGTYNASVTINNGTQTFTATQAVRVAGIIDLGCPTMTPGVNVFIGYLGTQSGCSAGSGNCKALETLNFTASSFGYNYGCAPHTFLWNFGDGTTSTDQNPAHAYAQGGDYTVSLKITNPAQNVTHTRTIKVTATGSSRRRSAPH